MPKILPKWYSKSIYDIDLEKLKSLNVKYLLSDLDNTIVGFDVSEPTQKVYDFLKELKENNIELILVSNNNKKRLTKFCKPCNLKFLSSAGKPGSKKLLEFISLNQLNVKECAFVGDQLLTDMWCANKAGCISILVEPLQKKESVFTFFNRRIDRIIRRKYKKKGKLVSIMKGE